jgi:copper oxidase (laccase) domain-containing protein
MLPSALQSRLLDQAGFRHAFFTRQGGVSEGPYASLNFAANTGDVTLRIALSRSARWAWSPARSASSARSTACESSR